jgi:hypothetical protein
VALHQPPMRVPALALRWSTSCKSEASIAPRSRAVQEFTHLAVAAAAASGVADGGIDIEVAARRLTLDFIPLFVEDYYLLGKRETVERTTPRRSWKSSLALQTGPGPAWAGGRMPQFDAFAT